MTQGKVEFAEIQRVLALFTEAIAGRPLHLKPLDGQSSNSYISRIATDGQSIHIPQSVADFVVRRHNFGAYRVIVLHQIGYLDNGTFAFNLQAAATRMKLPAALVPGPINNRWQDDGRRRVNSDQFAPPKPLYSRHQLALPPTRPVSELERFFAAWRRPDLMRIIFVTLEDLRIDTILRRRYPGARADLDRVLAHALAGRPNIRGLRPLAGLVECLVQFSLAADRTALLVGDGTKLRAALLDAAAHITNDGAQVYDSARIAIDIYHRLEALIGRQRQRRQRERMAVDGSDSDDTDESIEEADDANDDNDDGADESGAQPEAGHSDSEAEDIQAADEDITGSGIEFRGELMPDLVHRQLGGGQIGVSQSPEAPKSETSESPSKPWNGHEDSPQKLDPARFAASRRGLPDGPRSYLYDEWDYLAGAYQSAWCRLYEHQLRGSDIEFMADVRRRHARLAQQIKRQFGLIKPESWQRVYRTSDGDELGLDSLIEAVIDRRTGQATDEHLYVRRDRALREVAAAFLVDMSASTDFPVPDPVAAPVAGPANGTRPAASSTVSAAVPPAETGPYLYGGYDDLLLTTPAVPRRRVIDVAKESLALMCDALQTLGDSYAVYGFSGEGRDNVEFYVAKDFDDRLSAQTWGALAAMQPRRSTRMGPAIRHAAVKLARQPMRLKVLIIISDGYPQDSDYGPNRSDDEYGIQDTARALQEAERSGISTFCITIDPAGHDYLRRMCSENRYLVIDDVRSLPDELTKVYRALTA